nr:glycosyltransferase [uncultured Acetatifactor sp.]
MSEPLITVIMPSLNVRKYIRTCMDSVVGQSRQELEILCIDAGSTDGTLEILKEYAQADNRIKICQSDVKSYGKQINMGIELARGKYIAVAETDDYIDPQMYEKLYAIAEADQLDFVKADFWGFRVLRNGNILYDEGRVWSNDEVYGKILSVEEYPELYVRDVNIWKGLYNRNFLKNNDIRLNETPGAAFQDIGFCHLFLLHAKRGMYVKDKLYFYRRDNAESSSNRPYGLCYAYQEYRRLFSLPLKDGKTEQFYHYLYIRMTYVFMGEYEKTLQYDQVLGKEFQEAISWFKDRLSKGIQQKQITEKDIGEKIWEKLNQIINHEEQFLAEWYKKKNKVEKEQNTLLNKVGQEKAIIFGCGHYGRECLLFCDNYNVSIAAFSDNNSGLWGENHFGYAVCNPMELHSNYPDTKILIATPKYEKEIRKQLVEIGIREDYIISFPVFV